VRVRVWESRRINGAANEARVICPREKSSDSIDSSSLRPSISVGAVDTAVITSGSSKETDLHN